MTEPLFYRMASICGVSMRDARFSRWGLMLDIFELYVKSRTGGGEGDN